MTAYRVLQPNSDISGFFGEPHGWPTIVASRGAKLVGALSTHDVSSVIVCGPLKVVTPNPVHVALRLVMEYDDYMASIGVVAYWVRADKANQMWVKGLERAGPQYGTEKIYEDEETVWYRHLLVKRRVWAQKVRRIREKIERVKPSAS